MTLSHEDVQEILRLLDDSNYGELTLETDRFTLHLKRVDDGNGWTQETSTKARIKEQGTKVASITNSENISEPDPTEDGLLEIRAPMVGTFYYAAKPGADPFTGIGSRVNKDSVIGIIEVMKLMNSIPAGQEGEIVEILAKDAQFIEKGQLLMRVRPTT